MSAYVEGNRLVSSDSQKSVQTRLGTEEPLPCAVRQRVLTVYRKEGANYSQSPTRQPRLTSAAILHRLESNMPGWKHWAA